MTFYYLCRDVKPGAVCSYKPGRTLLNNAPISRTHEAAQQYADTYNRHCHVDGVRYVVLPHDDTVAVVCDHYESR